MLAPAERLLSACALSGCCAPVPTERLLCACTHFQFAPMLLKRNFLWAGSRANAALLSHVSTRSAALGLSPPMARWLTAGLQWWCRVNSLVTGSWCPIRAGADKGDDYVQPGATYVYEWHVSCCCSGRAWLAGRSMLRSGRVARGGSSTGEATSAEHLAVPMPCTLLPAHRISAALGAPSVQHVACFQELLAAMQVPETSGPGPQDPDSIIYMYHSHVGQWLPMLVDGCPPRCLLATAALPGALSSSHRSMCFKLAVPIVTCRRGGRCLLRPAGRHCDWAQGPAAPRHPGGQGGGAVAEHGASLQAYARPIACSSRTGQVDPTAKPQLSTAHSLLHTPPSLACR